jgi:predicted site-specific integrase-resolvase
MKQQIARANELLTLVEASARTGVVELTLLRHLRKGHFRGVKLITGKHEWRIPGDEVDSIRKFYKNTTYGQRRKLWGG